MDVSDYREIPYYFGVNHCHAVFKKNGQNRFLQRCADENSNLSTRHRAGRHCQMNSIVECVPNFSEGAIAALSTDH